MRENDSLNQFQILCLHSIHVHLTDLWKWVSDDPSLINRVPLFIELYRTRFRKRYVGIEYWIIYYVIIPSHAWLRIMGLRGIKSVEIFCWKKNGTKYGKNCNKTIMLMNTFKEGQWYRGKYQMQNYRKMNRFNYSRQFQFWTFYRPRCRNHTAIWQCSSRAYGIIIVQ